MTKKTTKRSLRKKGDALHARYRDLDRSALEQLLEAQRRRLVERSEEDRGVVCRVDVLADEDIRIRIPRQVTERIENWVKRVSRKEPLAVEQAKRLLAWLGKLGSS